MSWLRHRVETNKPMRGFFLQIITKPDATDLQLGETLTIMQVFRTGWKKHLGVNCFYFIIWIIKTGRQCSIFTEIVQFFNECSNRKFNVHKKLPKNSDSKILENLLLRKKNNAWNFCKWKRSSKIFLKQQNYHALKILVAWNQDFNWRKFFTVEFFSVWRCQMHFFDFAGRGLSLRWSRWNV